MRVERARYFDQVRSRLHEGKLTDAARAGHEVLLSAWEAKYAKHDPRFLAYCLATAFHETGGAMQPVEENLESDGEPVLDLEPMVISRDMETDLLAEARRAAEAKKEAEFSLLRGGKLLSFRRGDIGFWPKIVPTDATPVKKADVALNIDLLRIKW